MRIFLVFFCFFLCASDAIAEDLYKVHEANVDVIPLPDGSVQETYLLQVENPESAQPLSLILYSLPDAEKRGFLVDPPLQPGETRLVQVEMHFENQLLKDPDNASYALINFVPAKIQGLDGGMDMTVRLVLPAGVTANEARWYGKKPEIITTRGDDTVLNFRTGTRGQEKISVAVPKRAFKGLSDGQTSKDFSMWTLLLILIGLLAGYLIYFLRHRYS